MELSPGAKTTSHDATKLAWMRVLGHGALRVDYGHGIAVNAAGRVLVAARFDAPEPDDTAELVLLDADGAPQWRVALTGTTHLRAPSVALDAEHAAYVVGPYEPSKGRSLAGCGRVHLVKLGDGGDAAWSVPLASMAIVQAIPVQPPIGVAADPSGGACVAWTESGTLRVKRFDADGAERWERRFQLCGAMDPRVGLAIEKSGATTLWGTFCGAIRFDNEGEPLASRGWDRFFARIEPDGRLRWARVLRADRSEHYGIAVHPDGSAVLAAVVPARKGDEREPSARDLYVAQLDADGSTTRRTRFEGAAHTSASVMLASTDSNGVALAGYFSGGLTIAGQPIHSTTAARESVFVACLNTEGEGWARALDGPELQAGLSVHGDASGAVVLAGWCAGSMDFGGERAAFFVARYESP